jgi:hypothetical protein
MKSYKTDGDSVFAHHFSDTMRLPGIIKSGDLRPDLNRIGGFPTDLLWATTNDAGDRTSSAMSPQGRALWRDGLCQFVRFKLLACDFTPFSDLTRICPEWTEAQKAKLVKSAAEMGERDTSKWLFRLEPLPLTRVVEVAAKSYGGEWVQIDLSTGRCIASSSHPHTQGVVIGNTVYMSTQIMADGITGFDNISRFPLQALLEP